MTLAPPNRRQPHFAKITLDPSPGTLLDDVAATAQYLADDGQTSVHFRHNGWNFIARPGGDHKVMIARWDCERKLPSIHQINCITSDGKGCTTRDVCQKEEGKTRG